MSSVSRYPKRLIEVDLPIRKISQHARREKQIRHGHISTLHLWWARRPLGACRAVLLAAALPDPLDDLCPSQFTADASAALRELRDRVGGAEMDWAEPKAVREALLEFIADFANWDLALSSDYVDTARKLTACAHRALTGLTESRILVADPFAGGGAIPLEALRLGMDAFASDLNPIAVLLNRIVLEYLPEFGSRLTDEVRTWGAWLKTRVADQLAPFYPSGGDATPIGYLWARTISCEGPGCGVEVPLIRSTWLANKGGRRTAMRLTPSSDGKRIDVDIVVGSTSSGLTGEGTIRKGSATCPLCKYTTPNSRVRSQLADRRGGTRDSRLLAIVVTAVGDKGRQYRLPTSADLAALDAAKTALEELEASGDWPSGIAAIPDEPIPRERPSPNARGLSAVTRMGMQTFGDLVTARQGLSLLTLIAAVRSMPTRIEASGVPAALAKAVATCLGLLVSKQVDRGCSLCRWDLSSSGGRVASTFGRQALSVVWDFVEPSPIGDASGDLGVAIEGLLRVLADNSRIRASRGGTSVAASATSHPLPDDAVDVFFTDPPYYDAIPYADLSDFFYVWLRRALGDIQPDLFSFALSPKDEEAIWNPSRKYGPTGLAKDEAFYESQMAKALREGRRITAPGGIGVVVFAHKSTAGWEAILGALLDAGWIATASWPIDTEMGGRVNAVGTASLASSVHIVCRPRETRHGSEREATGDWRDVLVELPKRIHDWMPRLSDEGVVGADAIFACLGPALEIFSRYSRVEKSSGDVVTLKEYLEQVWAAVAHEALVTVLGDADSTSVEPDARLSVIWLWTLGGGKVDEVDSSDDTERDGEDDDGDGDDSGVKLGSGFVLEYDAARKLAQGLGAKLEELTRIVEVNGNKARLISVSERLQDLFGKAGVSLAVSKTPKRKQAALPGIDRESAAGADILGDVGSPRGSATTLDRLHQAMLLFAAGRGEALKRFLVEDGVGKSPHFWTLAQAFSALYPAATDERRWVDGVLARKKGLGF